MAFNIPARYELKKKHLMTKEACAEKVVATLGTLPWLPIGFLKDTPEYIVYDYKSKGSMLTFAERIIIYIGATEILVKSECLFPAQFIDFGKNKRNVNDFFKAFNSLK